MSQSDSEEEKRYRNKALLLSLLVSIYSWSGVRVEGNLELYGFKLPIENPLSVELVTISIMLYFVWKHWLISGFLRKDSYNATLQLVALPDMVKNIAMKKGKDKVKWELEKIDDWHNLRQKGNFFHEDITDEAISLSCVGLVVKCSYKCVAHGKAFQDEIELKFSDNKKIWLYAWLSYFNAALKSRFIDAFLPSAMCVIAITWYLCFYFSK